MHAASTTAPRNVVPTAVRIAARIAARVAARSAARSVLLWLVLAGAASTASAATYRCEVDGRVAYSDAPCLAGRQSTVAVEDPVSAADRAAAAVRARHDQATLEQIDRRHALERRQDLRAAALARRRDGGRSVPMASCGKLARRARDAHDAFDLAGPRDQPKTRLKMQRADQDLAALCKR